MTRKKTSPFSILFGIIFRTSLAIKLLIQITPSEKHEHKSLYMHHLAQNNFFSPLIDQKLFKSSSIKVRMRNKILDRKLYEYIFII